MADNLHFCSKIEPLSFRTDQKICYRLIVREFHPSIQNLVTDLQTEQIYIESIELLAGHNLNNLREDLLVSQSSASLRTAFNLHPQDQS